MLELTNDHLPTSMASWLSWLVFRTGIVRSRVQTMLKSWLFQASIRDRLNCDDHSVLDFKSAVQCMKYFIYHFTVDRLIYSTSKLNAEKDNLFKWDQRALDDACCPIISAWRCNCKINSQIRAADDQWDSRILIWWWLLYVFTTNYEPLISAISIAWW